jgi:hypothetical protein
MNGAADVCAAGALPYTTRCPHRVHPTSRRTAAIALAARALRAAGRKAKLKEYFHG